MRKIIRFRGEVVDRERLLDVLEDYAGVGKSGRDLVDLSDRELLLDAVLYLRIQGGEPERALGYGYRIFETPDQVLVAGRKDAGLSCQVQIDLFDSNRFLKEKRNGVSRNERMSDEEAIFLMMQTATPPDEYGFAVVSLVFGDGPERSF